MVLEKRAYVEPHSPIDAWNLTLGHEVCSNIQLSLDREWLVTNGLGGYAAGAIVGATTRSYHGLLVAALNPPVARTVLVAKIDEEVTLPDGQLLQLGVNEYQGGSIVPQGYLYLEAVRLDGDIVCFQYQLSSTLSLEKRIWMEYGQNTTYVQYSLQGSWEAVSELDHADGYHSNPVTVKIWPHCLARDYHSTTRGAVDWQFHVTKQQSRCWVRAYEGAPTYQLVADPDATFTPMGQWIWNIWHRRENERGLVDHEDVYVPGYFEFSLWPGLKRTLVLSAEAELSDGIGSSLHEQAVACALMRHQRRIRQILSVANHNMLNLEVRDPIYARLVLAADHFIVARPDYTAKNDTTLPLPLSPDRKTIIAGYPWFTDWGRDSMISLPGLLLCTGRYGEARGLLKAFASFVRRGLIPNRFPDGGEEPVYNTADATLWMFYALDRYLSKTHDWSLLKELFPLLNYIIQWHIQGTDYGIRVDQKDGLLSVVAPDLQMTWMDAKVGDWVVTPRRGKPVEINALWYAALTAMESWAVRLAIDATQYSQWRSQVRQNFGTRFWYAPGGYLYDVVDVDGIAGQNDPALRPNQLLAASLVHDLLSIEQVASLFEKVTDALLTPAGLRTLSPGDPDYHRQFRGNQRERDSAYHQGTVWPWLIGPYIDVHLRLYHNHASLRRLLLPLIQQLWGPCLGTISEVAEPEVPFTPAGCFAQAWSVAEVLRCWLLTAD